MELSLAIAWKVKIYIKPSSTNPVTVGRMLSKLASALASQNMYVHG